jgi:ribulose-5-phosphate 4-epimerase/fuculose-1-phosphate aldolase
MIIDGVVKYSAEHKTTPAIEMPPSVLEQWTELNEIRTKLHELGLIGVTADGIGYGNLSIRYREEEFLVSGTATGAKPVLSPSEYCLVTSFDIARNYVISRGPIHASAESMTHGTVYHYCSGVNCVIHIHSKIIFDRVIHDNYPATPKDAEYGTPEMAIAIGRLVKKTGKDEGQIVMSGHDEGIITYGANIQRAFSLILDLYNKYSAG